MQEHLAKLAQRESESVPTTELGGGTTAFYSERHRGDTEKKKAEMLVSYADVCVWSKLYYVCHSHTGRETRTREYAEMKDRL